MFQIQISVRNLVEFILRNGDLISSQSGLADPDAMQEGSRIHRKLQKRAGSSYRAEVPLSITVPVTREGIELEITVEGRADGIFPEKNGDMSIDEIKGIYRHPASLTAPILVHRAQAMCYGYIYAAKKHLKDIGIRITYCHIPTEEIRYFRERIPFKKIRTWFLDLVQEYAKWMAWQIKWQEKRNASIRNLSFPFGYREGQHTLVKGVYQSILRKKRLYIEAPTGVGKTISAVFPAVKSIGEGLTEKIFYLTAKTITRTVAEEAFCTLSRQGMRLKYITLTAKEKICLLDKPQCNPSVCPRALGHFDRVNDAVYEVLTREDSISREVILQYAEKHTVCPFEMSLDISTWCDAVIGDYNYAFDPTASLKRFFSMENENAYVFLIDEAHNLVDRAREMYSAVMVKEDFLAAKKMVASHDKKLAKGIAACNKALLKLKRDFDSSNDGENISGNHDASSSIRKYGKDMPGNHDASSSIRKYGRKMSGNHDALSSIRKYKAVEIESFVLKGLRLSSLLEEFFLSRTHQRQKNHGEQRHSGQESEPQISFSDMKASFDNVSNKMASFDNVASKAAPSDNSTNKMAPFDNAASKAASSDNSTSKMAPFDNAASKAAPFDNASVKAASPGLGNEDMEQLLNLYFDLKYFLTVYENLNEKYVVYSDFTKDGSFRLHLQCMDPSDNLGIYLTKGRSAVFFSATLLPIRYYKEQLASREDDYAIYAPSPFSPANRLLMIGRDVSTKYTRRGPEMYQRIADYILQFVQAKTGNYLVFFPSYKMLSDITEYLQPLPILAQSPSMSEADREAFLAHFREDPEQTMVGLCVMGGIFGEGIDLKDNRLIGAVIVGTGLPMVCTQNELFREYFEEKKHTGFDYAYRYPGMNKVLQAAGRVIRTDTDRGAILLLDERFLQGDYQTLFPREWEAYHVVNLRTMGKVLEGFWGNK